MDFYQMNGFKSSILSAMKESTDFSTLDVDFGHFEVEGWL